MRHEPNPAREASDLRRGGGTQPAERSGCLAFVTDEASEVALRGGMPELLPSLAIRRGDARAATRALEKEPTPGTLLVDVSGIEEPLEALEALAAVCAPDARVLVVGERNDIDFYRQLTRDLGVAEYLPKPLTRDLVARMFGPELRGRAAEAVNRGGQVIAICGARGGCGATTVAVNLAYCLAAGSRGHVALLDLNLQGGTAGMMLDLRPGGGLRVALEQPERVDALFLDRVGVPAGDRLRLIAADEPWDTSPQPTEDGVRSVIELLRHRFNHLVVDLPMPPTVAGRRALAMARHGVIVLGPDVVGIRDALALRKLLGSLGTGQATTVLNRAGLPGGLKTRLVAEGLGAAPDVVIPDLPRHLPRAANLGRPPASAAPEAAVQRLRTLVMERVDPVVASDLPSAALRDQLESLVHEIASRERIELSVRDQAQIAKELADDMVGYGPLEPLLHDESISDIMVNGPDRVFVEVRGKVQLTGVRFQSAAQLAAIAQKMAAVVGRRVDESSPLVDCRLPDGSRVNVVFPPLAIDGACISIRKFARRKVDFSGMVAGGSMSASVARILEIAARCRLNVVISGGTGSGKTTMMNAMSRLIDHGERIVTIEDAAELQLQQPHVVRLETRPVNLEGRGEITQRDLIRNALRMRPDRIIVGEVRGAEAFDMLQAMNTGHDGSYCTVHANSTRDAITRIENMVQMGQSNLPSRAIRTQIASAVDLIVQVARMRDGGRRVLQVSEVCGLEGEVVTMNDIFAFDYQGEDERGRIRGQWKTPALRPTFYDRLDYYSLGGAWMAALREAQP